MTHHTPGPWVAREWACHAATSVMAGEVQVAECSGFGRYAKDSLADARLIAQAPAMLALLERLVQQTDLSAGRRQEIAAVLKVIKEA